MLVKIVIPGSTWRGADPADGPVAVPKILDNAASNLGNIALYCSLLGLVPCADCVPFILSNLFSFTSSLEFKRNPMEIPVQSMKFWVQVQFLMLNVTRIRAFFPKFLGYPGTGCFRQNFLITPPFFRLGGS